MKAFCIDEPGKYSFKEIPEPVLREGEVLLRVKKIGYCGSDLNTWRGLNPLVKYPRIPGHEISGVVEKTASGVPGSIRVGDVVTAMPYTSCGKCWSCLSDRPNACKNNETLGVQREGALTEFVALPWEKIIDGKGLGLRELAIVEPLAIGIHAGKRCAPKEGEFMLVFGCGMIGIGAIAEGIRAGAKVIAVDVDDDKLGMVRAIGAAHTVNSRKENLAERVAEITGGHGPAVVLEAIGLPETFVQAVDFVAYSGRVVFVGYAKAPVTFDTKYFILKEISIRGSRGSGRPD
ncbi:MAG: sorbitol dehydrogenase, partial [Synergistetes bacterium HGW-Synergistetes-2]